MPSPVMIAVAVVAYCLVVVVSYCVRQHPVIDVPTILGANRTEPSNFFGPLLRRLRAWWATWAGKPEKPNFAHLPVEHPEPALSADQKNAFTEFYKEIIQRYPQLARPYYEDLVKREKPATFLGEVGKDPNTSPAERKDINDDLLKRL